MNGAFHFVAVEIVGSTEDDGAGCARLGALDHDQLVVADALLAHLHKENCKNSLQAFSSVVKPYSINADPDQSYYKI